MRRIGPRPEAEIPRSEWISRTLTSLLLACLDELPCEAIVTTEKMLRS
jgi:hypothetical protein